MKKTKVLFAVFALLVGFVAISHFAFAENENGNQGTKTGSQMGERGDQMKEARSVGSTLEVHISDNGKVLVRGAKVTAVSGNSLSAVTAWGSASINWTVNVDGSTEFVRRFGGSSSISEISVGDFVSFKGMLMTTASNLTVQAQILKDWSIQKVRSTFNGSVQSVDAAMSQFVLVSRERGNVTVAVTASTTIMKGDTQGRFGDIAVGSNVIASGLWNNLTNKLEADKINVRIPKPAPTTVQGTLKTTAASTFVLTVDGKDYTVNVAADTSVVNTLWLRLPLANLHIGDTVRVYGVVNVASSTIDATIVRDTSIR